ncbi:shikimate kinase [Piscibacillus sp. B03]|uniref:shikimate kinase n=1 Tax=Piscibacillus sp. B03 TaxID=3457430 RepID=UPI003FCE2D30
MNSIVLIGFMGVGKSTIGKELSYRLNLPFVDTDQLIEEETSLTIPKIFELYGEGHFRKLESEILNKVIQHNQVISTGGGIVELKQNRDFLKKQDYTTFLKASLNTIYQRLEGDQSRPLWNQPYVKRLELFNRRQAFYEEVSNLTIETDELSVSESVNLIISQLKL